MVAVAVVSTSNQREREVMDCAVCGDKLSDDGTIIQSQSVGPICFCSSCWDLIFHAVYESLRESGQIVDSEELP